MAAQATNIERLNTAIAKTRQYKEQVNQLQAQLVEMKAEHEAEKSQLRIEHQLHEDAMLATLRIKVARLEAEVNALQSTSGGASKRNLEESTVAPEQLKKPKQQEPIITEPGEEESFGAKYEESEYEEQISSSGEEEEEIVIEEMPVAGEVIEETSTPVMQHAIAAPQEEESTGAPKKGRMIDLSKVKTTRTIPALQPTPRPNSEGLNTQPSPRKKSAGSKSRRLPTRSSHRRSRPPADS